MPDPKEPQPPKPAGEPTADDLLSEMDDASLHGDWQAERERFRQRLTFRLGDLPVVDHGITVGHPVSRDQRFGIRFDRGHAAWLDDLFQYRTYSGVLLGVPDDPERQFESAMDRVKILFSFYEATPCLLPPTLHKGRRRVRASENAVERLEDWSLLPFVTSIALLTTIEPEGPDTLSSVAVIWYQDKFGMPDEAVLAQMRAIDWRRHAQPWDW